MKLRSISLVIVFNQGEKGIEGKQGPQGQKGDKGDTGAVSLFLSLFKLAILWFVRKDR